MILRFFSWGWLLTFLIIIAFVIFGFFTRLAHSHVVDVELCLREVLELEAKSDKIERDKEGNEACDRVNEGTYNDRDVERSVEHIRETTH